MGVESEGLFGLGGIWLGIMAMWYSLFLIVAIVEPEWVLSLNWCVAPLWIIGGFLFMIPGVAIEHMEGKTL